MAYKGLNPAGHPVKEMKRSRVMEIAPDVWNVEGYLSTSFFMKPPSCNCFILRDGDLVLLVDTGTYPFYREPILKILEKYRRDGARKLVLMLTQGHFDHVANNDLVLESGYAEIRFLLPEDEVSTIDLHGHWTGEFNLLSEYYDPYRAMPLAFPTFVPNLVSRASRSAAKAIISYNLKQLFAGIDTLARQAEILKNSDKVTKKFGEVSLSGWEVGRFFAIHDRTHSPGHLSFYDPKHKLLLTGDATLEINPAFFNSSLSRCIEMSARFKAFAEAGHLELVTDSHRSRIWSAMLAESFKRDPAHPLQAEDEARGKADCVEFFRFFEEYYRVLWNTVLGDLARLKEATVPQLVEEFTGASHPYARFKAAMVFPKIPSRLDVMVANVLKESGAPKRLENGKILFSPPEN